MTESGIEMRLDTTVGEIVIEAGVARGVLLSNRERLEADIVVSDVDPVYLYSHMVKRPSLMPRIKLKYAQSSMGLFVLYFGTTRRYDEVAHHTIWCGDRYRELLQDIFHNDMAGGICPGHG